MAISTRAMLALFFLMVGLRFACSQPAPVSNSTNSGALDLTWTPPPVVSGLSRLGGTDPKGDRVSVTNRYVEFNGKPWIMVAGEMHPTRYPAEYWEEEIMKMKAGGLNTVSIYIFWNNHEEDEGDISFADRRDIRKFVQLCQKHGLYVEMRIGPFCNGESKNGGLPDWLHAKGIKVRTNDPTYLHYVQLWYQALGDQVKGLMFKDGGPVIAVQIENEFQVAPFAWGFAGSGGQEHMRILKQMAIKAGFDVPLYICTGWGGAPVPPDEFLVGQGGYTFLSPGPPTGYYLFKDNHAAKMDNYDTSRYPDINIEIGPGVFCHDQWRPRIPPESTRAIATMMIARGGNLQGYYMYQGGTQLVGKHGSTGSFPFLAYDFQGPLREFGQENALYGALKPMNFFLEDFPQLLAPMVTALPAHPVDDPNDASDLRYGARFLHNEGFLFLNNYQDRVPMTEKQDVHVDLQLKGETIRVPQSGGLTLQRDQCVVFPFNLDLEGARLKSAIAQLYMRIQVQGHPVYVFFVPHGMSGEYVFDSASISSVDAAGNTVTHQDKTTRVQVQPGTGCLVQIKTATGKQLAILTLTEEQALHLAQANIFGGPHLVLSDDDVLFSTDQLRISKIGDPNFSFAVYPPVTRSLGALGHNLTASADGVFSRYQLQVPLSSSNIQVSGLNSPQVSIRVPDAAFNGVNDVFLRVTYNGDIAEGYLGGQRVCDNLFNHTVWEIGLKRFRTQLAKGPLTIKVTPPKPITEYFDGRQFDSGAVGSAAPKQTSMVLQSSGSTPAPDSSSSGQGSVSSVVAVPEYAAWVESKP